MDPTASENQNGYNTESKPLAHIRMNWIKRIFGSDNKTNWQEEYKLNLDEVYFHEDYYCQIELLPTENSNELKTENKTIDEFAKEHFDGNGFTDIYVRDEQKVKTSERNIQLDEFDHFVISLGFQKMRNVYSGYSSYRETCQNTNAYSIDGAYIFCDYENRVLKNIWLHGFRFNKDSSFIKEMTEGLFQIGKRWKLTLNDWDLKENINLKDKSEIELYITEK